VHTRHGAPTSLVAAVAPPYRQNHQKISIGSKRFSTQGYITICV